MSDLPVLYANGNGIAEAWEKSVIELYNNGLRYNRSGPKDNGNLQVDSTMIIEIKDIDNHPFYHKFSNCSWEDLLEYGFELLGAKNFLTVNEFDLENDNRWPYQYSDRILNYPARSGDINQIENIINRLSKKPHTRGSSVSIWVPDQDINSKDPACLQHLWFSLIPNEEGNENKYDLNLNYMFRSRNTMIAAPINMFGIHLLQNYVKDQIKKQSGFNVENGRIVDYSNSYHVSSRDMEKLSNFMRRIESTKGKGIESRVFSREDTFDMMKDCFDQVQEKVKKMIISRYDERKKLGKGDPKKLELSFNESMESINIVSKYLMEFIENVRRD